MSEFNDQARPSARHRDDKSTPLTKSQSVLKNAARRGKSGYRMSVVAGVIAAGLGVASLGQAANAAFTLPEMSKAAETQSTAQSDSKAKDAVAQAVAKADAARQAAADKAAADKAAADKATADKAAADQAAAAKAAADKATADQAAAAQKAAADAATKQAADAADAQTAAAAQAAATPVAVDDPAGAKAYAASVLSSYGWGQGEMTALNALWEKESGWRTTATNASSGAYGIVQSLPASKMATAGADWQTNYQTQIKWGLDYIKQRYGSPSAALAFHLANNWY
ncbi:hypothetical protein [Arthrobacter sp. efr-133-TYG-104]|uniref:aggregation-promoting factor C-terminal-like domain-containing protein n=1 Tax=Arthrobacter sp. efr-133-TYG-104 TaxID=3040324 RepID=UPI00254B6ABA|nr:hypothetical protein [Arthrobacter sp. efr-133-TYG-104]